MIDYAAASSFCVEKDSVPSHDGSWSLGPSRRHHIAPPAPTVPEVRLPDWVETCLAALTVVSAIAGWILGWALLVAILAVPVILFGAAAVWFLSTIGTAGIIWGLAYCWLRHEIVTIGKEIKNS